MTKQSILYILLGFFFGALVTMSVAAHAVNTNNRGLMSSMGIRPQLENKENSQTHETEKNSSTQEATDTTNMH